MRNYTSLRKKNSATMAVLIALLACVVLSGALLTSRLLSYSPEDRSQGIPLTKSNGITHVTTGSKSRTALPMARPLLLAATPYVLTATPGFQAGDDDTVWSGETEVEIFSIRYDNESGETTVHSQDGVKVLAPGTGNVYSFYLENTGNVSLDYTLQMDAWFSDTQYPIPIYVSVTDHQGKFLVGSEAGMVDVLQLKSVDEAGTIAAGNVMPYTLTWEWPFELDDAYDTMLGNLAVEQEISLTIVIKTTASYSADPNEPGGVPPQTGDNTQVAMYAGLMLLSLAGILLLLLRRKEEANEMP